MRKHWWKALGIIILLYVFFAGMLIPLKPGITQVTPATAKTGETITLRIQGYNTSFLTTPDQTRIWLKADNQLSIKAEKIVTHDDRHLEATFLLPNDLPEDKKVKDLTLLIDRPIDGAFALPSAIFVTQNTGITATGTNTGWNTDAIDRLHDKTTITFPFRNILKETIRNTYFHVPQWFAMLFIFMGGVYYSYRYLRKPSVAFDQRAVAFTNAGLLFGMMGLLTGAIWANYTWGKPWSWDIKQNMTAVALLIYFAYFVLRGSFDDPEKKARLSAVYNLFAFSTLIPLLYVIPRMTDSLHPGSGGNPAFGSDDLDNTMRLVFYPAIIGWTLLGIWIAQINYRILRMSTIMEENDF